MIKCPKCGAPIPPEQVNVGTDIAFCTRCNDGFKVSSVVTSEPEKTEFPKVTQGTWFREDADGVVVGATTRSPIAFFLVPFMLVWSGGSLGGIYGSQLASGKFHPIMSLFGIPFVLGSVLFWSLALMSIWGKVEVHIGRRSSVFVGIGSLGWTRQFSWPDVKAIRECEMNLRYPGGHQGAISLEGATRLRFGSGLNASRLYFVVKTLKALKAEATTRRT